MTFRNRRSVAPVIATLLMVAIAVVGGMLVFVFSQDFFTQTDSMTGPVIEQIQIYGYDARDVATKKIENHEGATCDVLSTVDGKIAEGQTFALYVRNLGNQPVVINEVNIFGTGTTEDAGALTDGMTDLPAPGKFTVVTIDTCADVTTVAGNPIAIGDDATILVAWDTAAFGTDPKVGRPIFVSIETTAGNIFTKNLISGRSVG